MTSWLRAVRISFWLGWKVESNWISPRLFVFYAVFRPVAGALILVFMYVAVTTHTAGPMLGFLVVGTAFWPFAFAAIRGGVIAVIEDREQHQTAGMLYTAPISHAGYVVGRALAQMTAIGIAAAIVTLSIGAAGLGVHYAFSVLRVALIVAGMGIGVVGLLAFTVLAMSVAINLSGESWQMPEGVNAALYLLTGAVFPLTVLPVGLLWIGRAFPMTWWLEMMRRALLPPGAPSSFPGWSDGEILGGLLVFSAIWLAAAALLGRAAENRARGLGLLDARSGY